MLLELCARIYKKKLQEQLVTIALHTCIKIIWNWCIRDTVMLGMNKNSTKTNISGNEDYNKNG